MNRLPCLSIGNGLKGEWILVRMKCTKHQVDKQVIVAINKTEYAKVRATSKYTSENTYLVLVRAFLLRWRFLPRMASSSMSSEISIENSFSKGKYSTTSMSKSSPKFSDR